MAARARLRSAAPGLTALCVLLCCASPVFAADPPDINAQSFELAAGSGDGLLLRSARRQDDGDWQRSWHLVGGLHYTRRALAFVNKSGAAPLTQTVLGDLWMLDVGGSVGFEAWTFEAVLPVAVHVRGGGPDLVQVGDARSPAFGDLRLAARRWLLGRSFDGLGRIDVAAMIGYGAPTAAAGSWLGSGGLQLDAAALVTWSKGPWRAHVNAGARLRGREALVVQKADPATGLGMTDANGAPMTDEALVTGSLLRGQASVGRSFGANDQLVTSIGGQLALPVGDVTAGQQLLEVYVDAAWALDQRRVFRLFGGMSAALTGGYGSSQARGIAGLRFVPGNLPSDEDGDGLDDRDDACPKEAEDFDGFEDKDGCPDLDNDNDGIPDTADRCPLRPEDIDKHEDSDGCPDEDNDEDGIPDASDRCPLEAEDFEGFDDHDGCPDRDNDGDGIPDADDLCPNQPETRNGRDDQDGCPDTAAAPAARIDGDRILLATKVRFGFRSAVLAPEGKRQLDGVVAWLKATPAVTALQVRGHTDDNGDPAELQMLSKQRAIAVRDYLDSKRALPTGKISAIGLGGSQPIQSNQTLAGRSANRRIELVITGRAKPIATPPPAKSGPPPADVPAKRP